MVSVSDGELKKFLPKNEIPVRFCYSGLGWKKVATDPDYGLGQREMAILYKSTTRLARSITAPINVLHLGIGEGREISWAVKTIGLKNIATYGMLDINPAMLRLAASNARKKFPRLQIRPYLADIETDGIIRIAMDLKKNGADQTIILLTGNSVLFSNPKISRMIAESMNFKDRFFISLELFKKQKEAEIFGAYLISSVLNLLSVGIRRAGLTPDRKKFFAEYDKKRAQLNIFFRNKKQNWLVLTSYKPANPKLLERKLASAGFKKEFLLQDKKSHCCAGLFRIRASLGRPFWGDFSE